MDLTLTSGREPWLPDFFGGENCIRWPALAAGTSDWRAPLAPWLELAAGGRADLGLVLPAQRTDGGVVWYACAGSRQDRAALAEQIASFLGPTQVDFDRTRPFVPALSHERVLAQRFSGGVMLLTPHPDTDPVQVNRVLWVLAGLLLRRPRRQRQAVRPFATVRAEFEQALLTGDETRARRCIDELRATGRLSAANERFLHVRLLVALGREATLVHDASMMSLLADAQLPIRVLRDVIEALYTVHLTPLETGAPVEVWIETWQRHLRRHERLFRTRRGLRAPAVLRAFLLHEAARPSAEFRVAEATALHDALAVLPEHRDWAGVVLAWAQARQQPAAQSAALAPPPSGQQSTGPLAPLPSTPPTVPVAASASEVLSPSSPPALAAEPATIADWASQPPSPQALAGLLQAAIAVGTLEAASEALTVLRAYPSDLLHGLSPLQKGMLGLLEQLVPAESDVPPSDWTEWARWWATAGGGEADAERGLAIAEQGAEQWDHAAWLAATAGVREFTALLQAHPQRFRPYLATIYGSLQELSAAPGLQADLLVQMAMVVALDAPQPADLPLLCDWTAALVRLGAGRALCDEMAGALHAAWSEVRSLRCLDWACDVVELLAAAPRTPGGELEMLFSDVLGLAVAQQHRLAAVQRRLLCLLARDFGQEFTPADALPPASDDTNGAGGTALANYEGVSIGIYTLQESIVAHLRAALHSAFPGARVQFNHDHAATPALEHMARHSSVMVFAWRCSKHQAFYCIQKQRPADLPLLQPQGRGSASILRELTEHFHKTCMTTA